MQIVFNFQLIHRKGFISHGSDVKKSLFVKKGRGDVCVSSDGGGEWEGGTLDWDREILSLPFSCFIT